MSPILFLFLFLPSLAQAAGPTWPISDIPRFWILGEGNTHFSIDGTFFRTKENYDTQGFATQPATMESVRYGNTRFHLGFGFTPRVSLFAQADLRGIFATNARGSFISDDDNYSFGDAFLGIRWLLYRSKSSNRIYPTEWSAGSWLLLAEGTWLFPLYDRPQNGKPPVGNQSNDFTNMLRAAWYANEWLALSASAGYTFRTAAYANEIPWSIRSDFLFQNTQRLRLWLELKSTEGIPETSNIFNPKQPDAIPGGSLLFKSEAPTERIVSGGFGYLFTNRWEGSIAGLVTSSGINSAKGFGGTLGIVYRPYQVPEVRYETYRREQKKRAQEEREVYSKRNVLQYGFTATILKVSLNGNFVKIGYGSADGVKEGDAFEINEPDDLILRDKKAVAYARVVAVRTNSSFLRVEKILEPNIKLIPGYQAQRVTLDESF